MFHFYPLTGKTSGDIFCNISFHTWPPIVGLQIPIHFGTSRVCGKCEVVRFLSDSFLSSGWSATQRRSLNLKTLSVIEKFDITPFSTFCIILTSSGSFPWLALILSTRAEVNWSAAILADSVRRMSSIWSFSKSLSKWGRSVNKVAITPYGFLLKASATTLAFPGWYLMSNV